MLPTSTVNSLQPNQNHINNAIENNNHASQNNNNNNHNLTSTPIKNLNKNNSNNQTNQNVNSQIFSIDTSNSKSMMVSSELVKSLPDEGINFMQAGSHQQSGGYFLGFLWDFYFYFFCSVEICSNKKKETTHAKSTSY